MEPEQAEELLESAALERNGTSCHPKQFHFSDGATSAAISTKTAAFRDDRRFELHR